MLVDFLDGPTPQFRLAFAEHLHARALDGTGQYAVNVDVVWANLDGDGAGEPAKRPLGCAVSRPILITTQPGVASDCHDLPSSLGDHSGQHVLDGQEGADDVDIKYLTESLGLDVPYRRFDRTRDASHVDQDVDTSAEERQRAIDHRSNLGGIRDVGSDDLDLTAQRAGLVGDLFEGIGVTGGDHEIGAFPGQGQTNVAPHAFGAAGDDRNLVFQFRDRSPLSDRESIGFNRGSIGVKGLCVKKNRSDSDKNSLSGDTIKGPAK